MAKRKRKTKFFRATPRKKNNRSGTRFDGLNRGRESERGVRNQTETRYEKGVLQFESGVVRWWFEPMNLKLGHRAQDSDEKGVQYTPDFMVLMDDGRIFLDDVKGSGPDNEASIVRLKMAAQMYPHWIFRKCKERGKDKGFVRTVV